MNVDPDIARLAQLLAEPARAKILWTLIDGTTRPAGELAFAANVSAQSASAHLAKLVEGGLLRSEAVGRHRYYRLASAEAARILESMASFSAATKPRSPPEPAIVKAMPRQFFHARTCYDHLAGEAAVAIAETMLAKGWLLGDGDDYVLTPKGEKALSDWGVDLQPARQHRRVFARACVDLTQRRLHLGGALGAALLAHYIRQRWVLRSPASRIVTITPDGLQAFASLCAPVPDRLAASGRKTG
ncbi:MAG: helix-turn-helix transcriptional regulator [Burkholderiaceae bacterium]|jgi:DNA-binding transcriptional ArsR family regulator